MPAGIYILTNQVSGKHYVGQSWDIDKRLTVHSKGKGIQLISRAIRKYGWQSFSIEVIQGQDNVDQFKLDLLECQYIDTYNSLFPLGYNMTSGGANGRPTDEIRQKISQGLMGHMTSEATKQKISNTLTGRSSPRKGVPCSEEHRRKLSLAAKGRPSPKKGIPWCKEQRQKLSASCMGRVPWNKGIPHSEQARKNISIGRKGIPVSEEQKQKTSATLRATWAAKKSAQINRGRGI